MFAVRGSLFAARTQCFAHLPVRVVEANGKTQTAAIDPFLRLLDAQLLSCFGAEAFRGPGWSPDHIDLGVADSGELFDPRFDLGADVDVFRATLCGEGHIDGHVLLVVGGGVKTNVVDQAEIDNVDGNLGIVALPESAENVFLG